MDRIMFHRKEVEGPWIPEFVGDPAFMIRNDLNYRYSEGSICRTTGIYIFVIKTGTYWFAPWDAVDQSLCKSFHIRETDVPVEIKLKVLLLRS